MRPRFPILLCRILPTRVPHREPSATGGKQIPNTVSDHHRRTKTATIAPLGISTAASSAVRHGYVLFVAIVSTSFELRRTPLKKRPDTLLIIGAVINPAPYCLNPLEPFRVKRVRFAEDTQLLFQ